MRAVAGRARRLASRLRHTAGPGTGRLRLDPTLVTLAADLVGSAPAPRIAVIARSDPGGLLRALAERLPGAVIDSPTPTDRPTDRHVELSVAAPFDLVLDVTMTAAARRPRVLDSFHRLRPGGHVVVAGAADDGSLAELLAAAQARVGTKLKGNKAKLPAPLLEEHALGRALTSVKRRDGHLVLGNGLGPAQAKLRDAEAEAVLALLPELGHRDVDTVPGVTFESRCVLRESAEERGRDQPTTYHAPPAHLREYRDVLVAPGQVVADERFLWPETFRHGARRRLRNRNVEEASLHVARLPFRPADVPVLEGTYFHLDNEVRGHFGHLLTEQVSRMWAWPEAKERHPDLKVLVGSNKRRPELLSYELTVYAAAGITADDILLIREPVRVERLLSPTPMMSNPDYVHPAVAETWRRVGDGLAAGATGGPRPQRIFCSRRIKKRECHNTAEVEDIFRAAGFEVIFPEDYPLGDQVEMFRAAEVLAGFAGSGLFNLCFVDRPTHVIMIASDAYTARNEYLFASVLGHRIDSITSVADEPGSFQSSFTFDVDREGRFLAAVLADLPD